MQLTVQTDIYEEFKFLLVHQTHAITSSTIMQNAPPVKGCTCQPPLNNASMAFSVEAEEEEEKEEA